MARGALAVGALAVLAGGMGLACGGEPASPEARARAVVTRFEAAAEARDIGAALDGVSDGYRDAAGHDKRAIKALVVRYFLGHEALYVVSRIRSLELADPPDRAHLVVVAALTGAPVEKPGDLAGLSADVYRFELDVAREDDGVWRITSARWRPARPAELL